MGTEIEKEILYRVIEEKTQKQRQSLYEFIKHYWACEKKIQLDENRHLEAICKKLEDVYAGRCKRLIINIPPRSLKTETVSIAFPAWCLGHEPNLKFMEISYSAELAQKNSGGCRDMYNSDTYYGVFPRRVGLKDDQNTKQHRVTTEEGQYYAAGSTGTITGIGADIIIIDDPINPEEANSDLIRRKVNNNYHDTIKSRLNNVKDGAIVVIMQRLHDDDLTGHLIEKMVDGTGEKWDLLIVPAIKGNKSFFEKRFPLEILKKMQTTNPMTFSTQYLQDPVSKESQEFHEEWFRYYTEEPKDGRIFTVCDPAFSKKDSADYSCIMTGMFKDMDLYILEYTVGRYDPAELQDKLLYHNRKYNPEKIGIEAYQAQTIISFNLRAELEKKGMYVNIEEIKQTGDKETKIRKLIPLYRNGYIFHKIGMDELEHELKRFPKGRHDDIIDSLQMLYNMYELHPGTKPYQGSLEIKYNEYGQPIYIGNNNDQWQSQLELTN